MAKLVAESLSIPVIGIGAGPDVDGQVLVLQDMLGISPGKPPKFVKNFTREVPVEVYPLARNSVVSAIKKLGGDAKLRSLDKGYPFFTENGNIVLDCNFGIIIEKSFII